MTVYPRLVTGSSRRLRLGAACIVLGATIALAGCFGGGEAATLGPAGESMGQTLDPASVGPAPTPSATPFAAPTATTLPEIPGVSAGCIAAVATFAASPSVIDVLETCRSLGEIQLAEAYFATGQDWSWEIENYCGYQPDALICASLPTPEPTTPPMTADRAKAICQGARPKNLYGVTAKMQPLRNPGEGHLVWVQLVEFRNLNGRTRPEPRLSDATFYDFPASPFVPGGVDDSGDVDLVACIALQARELEHWYYTSSPGTLYPVYKSDAILWVVDVAKGRRLGSAWRLHPPTVGSGDNYIYLGIDPSLENPGQRAPRETQIIASVTKFLGR
jgi:hypothetical protein